MCGPLVMSARLPVYHAVRLTAYMVWGAGAGAWGASALFHEYGDTMSVVLGAGGAALSAGALIWLVRGTLKRSATAAVAAARKTEGGGMLNAAALGLASALLPCGWLHIFVAVAAATASPGRGALLMFFFGLGTIPALSAVNRMWGWLGAFPRRGITVALLACAMMTIVAHRVTRWGSGDAARGTAAQCHSIK